MPTLPRIVSTKEPALVRQPLRRVEDATVPAEAAARLGQRVAAIGSDIVQKVARVQAFNIENERVSNAALELDQIARESEAQPDFRGHEKRVTSKAEQVINRALSGTTGELQARIRAKLLGEQERAIFGARAYTQDREIAFGQEQLLHDNQADLTRAGEAEGEELRAILSGVGSRLDKAVELQVIRPVDRERLGEEFKAKLLRADLMRDMRLDPVNTLRGLVAGAYPLDPEEREQRIREAKGLVIFEDDQRRKREDQIRQDESRAQRLLSQTVMERAAAGQDVAADLSVGKLGEQYQETFNAVRGIQASLSRGDLTPSNPSVFLSLKARVFGPNPPSRREIIAAGELGPRNGVNGADMISLLSAVAEKERTDSWTPEQRLALGNAEQIIRDRLKLKVPGVDKYTEIDGERQALATNNALIEFFNLEKQSRAKGEAFDALQVAKDTAERWRNSSVISEGVSNVNGQMMIFGQHFYEGARLEIARRNRAGLLDDGTARLLLRTAEQMPRKPVVTPAPPPVPREQIDQILGQGRRSPL